MTDVTDVEVMEAGYKPLPKLGEGYYQRNNELFQLEKGALKMIGEVPESEREPETEKTLEDFKPANHDDFKALEERDESQIVNDLSGNVIDEFVYKFKQGDREVKGISWAGIKHLMAQMGSISVEDVEIIETATHIRAKARVIDKKRDVQMIAFAEQPKVMKTRSGEIEDNFALSKVNSKAIRNAVRGLIPEALILEMIKKWKGK